MTDSKQQASGGISFLGLLAIVFITLKLCNVITWSWWWVTAPLWIPVAFCAAIALIVIIALFIGIFTGNKRRR